MKSQLFGVFAVLGVLISSSIAQATISIPTNLTDGEQQQMLQIVGIETAFRPVDNPYPLGGYSGFEFGISLESVPTADVGYFGSHAPVDRNLIFPRISFGKGIYDSVDAFFSFIPYNQNTGLGIYGGAIRWTFFQATFVPASFSILGTASNTNLNNLIIAQTESVDIVSGVNADPVSFYIGAGTLFAQAQFDQSITSQGSRTNQMGRSFHTVLGLNLAINEVFAALEIDTYSATTVSLKLGARL